MASIKIRNLEQAIKERLRVRAAEHGHSMEAGARNILETALSGPGQPQSANLFQCIHARFAPLGSVKLKLPLREPAREPPRFG
ncbi:MAG: plasmid stabilization protein [Beijerinckiaceae bacterium]|nr:plasmid stabilization protein [Beijerinckiaceae bacterium]